MNERIDLDRQVAEEVMGWPVFEDYASPADPYPRVTVHLDGLEVQHKQGSERVPWCPYSDRTQALDVAERLRDLGFDVDLTLKPEVTYGCRVAPRGVFNTSEVIFNDAITLHRAIVRSAIDAIPQIKRKVRQDALALGK